MVKQFSKALALLLCCVLLSTPSQAATGNKVLYHLNKSGFNNFRIAISNIENLFRGMPRQQLEVTLILQGKSIQILDPRLNKQGLSSRLQQLRKNGVRVEVGQQNFDKYSHLVDLSNPPLRVANIFKRIIDLQKQGYRYITP